MAAESQFENLAEKGQEAAGAATKRVRQATDPASDSARDAADQVRQRASDTADQVRQRASDTLDRAQDATREIQEQGERLLGSVADFIQQQPVMATILAFGLGYWLSYVMNSPRR